MENKRIIMHGYAIKFQEVIELGPTSFTSGHFVKYTRRKNYDMLWMKGYIQDIA